VTCTFRSPSLTECTPCPPGTFSSSPSSTFLCTPCPASTYNPTSGATSCTLPPLLPPLLNLQLLLLLGGGADERAKESLVLLIVIVVAELTLTDGNQTGSEEPREMMNNFETLISSTFLFPAPKVSALRLAGPAATLLMSATPTSMTCSLEKRSHTAPCTTFLASCSLRSNLSKPSTWAARRQRKRLVTAYLPRHFPTRARRHEHCLHALAPPLTPHLFV